jgi:hypothetical protein
MSSLKTRIGIFSLLIRHGHKNQKPNTETEKTKTDKAAIIISNSLYSISFSEYNKTLKVEPKNFSRQNFGWHSPKTGL